MIISSAPSLRHAFARRASRACLCARCRHALPFDAAAPRCALPRYERFFFLPLPASRHCRRRERAPRHDTRCRYALRDSLTPTPSLAISFTPSAAFDAADIRFRCFSLPRAFAISICAQPRQRLMPSRIRRAYAAAVLPGVASRCASSGNMLLPPRIAAAFARAPATRRRLLRRSSNRHYAPAAPRRYRAIQTQWRRRYGLSRHVDTLRTPFGCQRKRVDLASVDADTRAADTPRDAADCRFFAFHADAYDAMRCRADDGISPQRRTPRPMRGAAAIEALMPLSPRRPISCRAPAEFYAAPLMLI